MANGRSRVTFPLSIPAWQGGCHHGRQRFAARPTLLPHRRAERAVGGRVLVDGQDVAGLGRDKLYAMRRRMGMLFQFGALFRYLGVFDNVAFPLREHTDLPPELIQRSGADEAPRGRFARRGAAHARRALGGMARWRGAGTIALDPMLLMYDEPFTGLDPISS